MSYIRRLNYKKDLEIIEKYNSTGRHTYPLIKDCFFGDCIEDADYMADRKKIEDEYGIGVKPFVYGMFNDKHDLLGYISGSPDGYEAITDSALGCSNQDYIFRIEVREDFRGLGIGTRLCNFVFDRYPESDFVGAANPNNRSLMQFYSKLGFGIDCDGRVIKQSQNDFRDKMYEGFVAVKSPHTDYIDIIRVKDSDYFNSFAMRNKDGSIDIDGTCDYYTGHYQEETSWRSNNIIDYCDLESDKDQLIYYFNVPCDGYWKNQYDFKSVVDVLINSDDKDLQNIAKAINKYDAKMNNDKKIIKSDKKQVDVDSITAKADGIDDNVDDVNKNLGE